MSDDSTTDPVAVMLRAAGAALTTALAEAEARGYERGRREATREATGLPETLRTQLMALATLVEGVKGSVAETDDALDSLSASDADDLIDIPHTGDSFDDAQTFLETYGGQQLVDPDNLDVDKSDVETWLRETSAGVRSLGEAIAALLATSETSEPTDKAADKAA